jgi:hypothetical protein
LGVSRGPGREESALGYCASLPVLYAFVVPMLFLCALCVFPFLFPLLLQNSVSELEMGGGSFSPWVWGYGGQSSLGEGN